MRKLNGKKTVSGAIGFLHFLIAIGISSCVAQRNLSGTPEYYENLLGARPEILLSPVDTISRDSSNFSINNNPRPDVTPAHNVNSKVDDVLDSIDRFNSVRQFVDGFTILIYSGQSRNDAGEMRKQMLNTIVGLEPSVPQYVQPNFQVTAGRYFTKLEAQKDLSLVKHQFPNAILVPKRIPIQ